MYYKSYKFKLKLTSKQDNILSSWINTCRLVYNLTLETKQYNYVAYKKILSQFDLFKQLTLLRHEFDWISDVPLDSLRNVVNRCLLSYDKFYKGAGFPKFANKNKYKSIVFSKVKIHTHNRVILPKIGSLKYFSSQPIEGVLKRATIFLDNGDYYISILTEQKHVANSKNEDNSSIVGLDMGISYFCVTSDGEYKENPRFCHKSLSELRIAQRSLSRKIKYSNNWNKQKNKVAKVHRKIKNKRSDFINKYSTEIIFNNSFVAIEKLNIKGMVRCKLSSHINDVGWGMFFKSLKYKANWYGTVLEEVSPRNTSITCNSCGLISKNSRITQSVFVCVGCGHTENADFNASKNILDRALSNVRQRETIVCA